MRFMTALVLTLMAAAPALASVDEDVYNRGRSAIFEERWEDARKTFDDLTRRFPESHFADDAQYWLSMSLYELGEAEKAYGVLKELNSKFPDSPWNDDARVLMVRCAESALKQATARQPRAPIAAGRAGQRLPAEYEAFIEKSTHDSNAKVQLLAIDTMLLSNPGRARELLPRLSDGRNSREAAGMVLDRFFGGDKVKVTLENPALGMRDGNVAIMIRDGDQVSYLSLTEATELVRSQAAPARPSRFTPDTVNEVRDKLVQTQKNLVRDGDPGTIQSLPGIGGRSMSAIVKVVDGEIHYYRSGDETIRILVLKRQAGFSDENIRIFAETHSGQKDPSMKEIALNDARAMQPAGAPGQTGGLSEATARYLKAALAIIEIDLNRSMSAGSK